jgi:hypothetical protein
MPSQGPNQASSGLVMQITNAGRVFLDSSADLLHHLEVDAQKIVAAHTRLARYPAVRDVRTVNGIVGIRAQKLASKPSTGEDSMRSSAFPCEYLRQCRTGQSPSSFADEMSKRAANLAGTDQRNLGGVCAKTSVRTWRSAGGHNLRGCHSSCRVGPDRSIGTRRIRSRSRFHKTRCRIGGDCMATAVR